MKSTSWKKQDGYEESIISFEENTTPILKARVVLQSDGNYLPLLRDYQTGVILAVGQKLPFSEALFDIPVLIENYIRCQLLKRK